MKKVKIMLFSIAIFAIVGVALAFKAKDDVRYCTTILDPVFSASQQKFTCPWDCDLGPIDLSIHPQNPLECYTTPEAVGAPCPNDCTIDPDRLLPN